MLGQEIRLQCVLYFNESLEGNKRDAQYRINVIYFMSENPLFTLTSSHDGGGLCSSSLSAAPDMKLLLTGNFNGSIHSLNSTTDWVNI